MKKKLTPDNIQELTENQIFVFGSNMNGNHAGRFTDRRRSYREYS